MKNRKNRAMTTMEALVSGSIMVGVIVMSFEVMVTGAKMSQKATNDSTANEESRSGLEQLVKDVQNAEAIVASKVVGSIPLTSGANRVILRLPKFDANGKVRGNEYEYIAYYAITLDGKTALKRISATEVNGNMGMPTAPKTIVDDLKQLDFHYLTKTEISFDPMQNGFVLPGTDVNKKRPAPTEVSVESISSSLLGGTLGSRSAVNADAKVLKSGNLIKIETAKVGDTITATFYVNHGKKKCPLMEDSLSNTLSVRVQTKRDDDGDSDDVDETDGSGDLTATATCRNQK
jgi:hypothetical protein